MAQRNLIKLALIVGIAAAFAINAAAESSGAPELNICVAARDDGALTGKPSTIYQVTIDWNETSWPKGERVDIGIWDHSGLIWRQGHFADIRRGQKRSVHDVVVQDAGVYPMTFGVIRMTPDLVREADRLCQNGFCSLVEDAPGLIELTDPVFRDSVLRLEGPGVLEPCLGNPP
jgi:hypothetical protein